MEQVVFLSSGENLDDFFSCHPELAKKKQIVFVGRSNVGKSSLLNHLVGRKQLAKTAKKPGKTALLQFFHSPFGILIDLPGYGFAKVSDSVKTSWEKSVLSVLDKNPLLYCVLFLLDIRRDPSQLDQVMKEWIQKSNAPFILIFTKTDTISEKELAKRKQEIEQSLDLENVSSILYTTKNTQGKKELTYRLKNGTFA